ncbi:hypothetical protein ALC62_03531 [Cyphomyrmex costatus]|uniref:Uncharacterized protein n=1 Tax=Cyphomyrmex costatus TaxID=456900 RepID=A0A151ILB2_9HYME|nr:hypothetical protein ALC62_03531 [Cyphomyrmex costatus]
MYRTVIANVSHTSPVMCKVNIKSSGTTIDFSKGLTIGKRLSRNSSQKKVNNGEE